MLNENTVTSAAAEAEVAGPPLPASIAGDDQRMIIESRFGTLAVATKSAVVFPNGLLGFDNVHNFVIADLLDPRFPQFKALQCLDDHSLSLLVLPLDPDADIIASADIDAACLKLAMARGDLAVLLVVTIRKTDAETTVSANLRAPLLIDVANRVGVQYVLPSDRYAVRHKL